MVFGNFFDSEDTQVKFKLIDPLSYVDLSLHFTKAAVTTSAVTSVTSAPAMVAKVLNGLTSNQGEKWKKYVYNDFFSFLKVKHFWDPIEV